MRLMKFEAESTKPLDLWKRLDNSQKSKAEEDMLQDKMVLQRLPSTTLTGGRNICGGKTPFIGDWLALS